MHKQACPKYHLTVYAPFTFLARVRWRRLKLSSVAHEKRSTQIAYQLTNSLAELDKHRPQERTTVVKCVRCRDRRRSIARYPAAAWLRE